MPRLHSWAAELKEKIGLILGWKMLNAPAITGKNDEEQKKQSLEETLPLGCVRNKD